MEERKIIVSTPTLIVEHFEDQEQGLECYDAFVRCPFDYESKDEFDKENALCKFLESVGFEYLWPEELTDGRLWSCYKLVLW